MRRKYSTLLTASIGVAIVLLAALFALLENMLGQ